MINPIERAYRYMQSVEPETRPAKIFALIPMINNIFLEVKRFQLENDQKKLKKFADSTSYYLWGQVIWAPVLAKLLVHISFKWRIMTLVSLAIYYPLSEKHIAYVKDLN